MADTRASQAGLLALAGGGDARASQGGALALAGGGDARASQAGLLLLADIPSESLRASQGGILALAGGVDGIDGSRASQAGLLVLCQHVDCLTHWAQCWRIERTDGQVFAFTSHDRPVPFRGETYQPCDSLSASASELAATLGSVGNMELAGLIDDDSISETELFGGLFDGARVEVWMVPWTNAAGETPWRLAKGTTGNMSQGEAGFSMEVLTPGALLQQQALLQTYTPACRFDLGDARCTVDLGALTVAGTVTSVAPTHAANAASRRIFSDTGRAEADGYFELGTLTWTGGRNAGARSEVKEFDGQQFTLWQPMLYPIEPGDAYEVAPGCDKSPATCKAKFDNFVNFGGFPDVPGRDSVTQSPNSK